MATQIGMGWMIMIVLGIIGIIAILFIFKESFFGLGTNVMALMQQATP